MRVSLENAAELILTGHVVAVPTETVYGLAAALQDPLAIDKIFSVKGRPSNNPLIIHVADLTQIVPFLTVIPRDLDLLANTFWPGPMTLVLEINKEMISEKARAHLPTAAFRIPSHPVAQQLLRLTGPLVMPSANLSGKPSATMPEHVESDFGTSFPVIDGGQCMHGLESSILYPQEGLWTIIRLGALAPETFKSVLGYIPSLDIKTNDHSPLCPGQLFRHYAPKAKLKLVKTVPINATGMILGFSDRFYPPGLQLISMGVSGNAEGVAENLYSTLRFLDLNNVDAAWVDMDFPETDLWLTIAERLKKAALV